MGKNFKIILKECEIANFDKRHPKGYDMLRYITYLRELTQSDCGETKAPFCSTNCNSPIYLKLMMFYPEIFEKDWPRLGDCLDKYIRVFDSISKSVDIPQPELELEIKDAPQLELKFEIK